MDIDQTLTAGNGSTCKQYPRKCSDCGADIMAGRKSGRVLCRACYAANRKEAHKRYRATEKGREVSKKACKTWREKYPEKTREYGKAYREEHREEIRVNRRESYWANVEEERRKARIRAQAIANKPGARLEMAKVRGEAEFCQRMRVSMLKLPCGQRPECWAGKPCEQCRGMAKPRDTSFGSISRWDF